MKKIINILLIILLISASFIGLTAILGANQENPEDACLGYWYDGDELSKFKIFKCSLKDNAKNKSRKELLGNDYYEDESGKYYCAKITWLKFPTNDEGEPTKDKENPKKELRDRELLGLTFMWAFEWVGIKSDTGSYFWKDGRIYNPNDGKTYYAEMYYNPEDYGKDNLIVKGKVGPFGAEQTWTRAEE